MIMAHLNLFQEGDRVRHRVTAECGTVVGDAVDTRDGVMAVPVVYDMDSGTWGSTWYTPVSKLEKEPRR
jgi:hypothetical protein